jgi:hypothetical protein
MSEDVNCTILKDVYEFLRRVSESEWSAAKRASERVEKAMKWLLKWCQADPAFSIFVNMPVSKFTPDSKLITIELARKDKLAAIKVDFHRRLV